MAAIIFDLDGTLIDSAPDIHAALNATQVEMGLPPLSLAQVTSFVGSGVAVLVARASAAQGHAGDREVERRMLAGFQARYADAVGLTRPYPGVPEALDRIAAAGHRLGLCTNKPLAPAQAILSHLGFDGRFDVVLGGDSLPQRKPDPAPLLAVLEQMGGGAAVYVGDSEIDAETAERADLPFALFTEGYRKVPVEALRHQARFDDFAQLPGIVARLLGD